MGHGVSTVYSVVIASAATLSAEIDLGRSYRRIYVDITGAGAEARFQATDAAGGTYRQVYHPTPASATVQANIFKIATGCSGGLIEGPAGLRFMKVETTSAVDDGVTIKIHCAD